MIKYKRTLHLLHLIITLFTGFWVFVWIWRTLSNAEDNKEQMFHAIVNSNK